MDQDSESTVTSLDENTENLCDNPTRDTLADGLISLFKPVVDQLDERVRTTRFDFIFRLSTFDRSVGRLLHFLVFCSQTRSRGAETAIGQFDGAIEGNREDPTNTARVGCVRSEIDKYQAQSDGGV